MTLHDRAQKIVREMRRDLACEPHENGADGRNDDCPGCIEDKARVAIIERHLQEMQQEGWTSVEERLPERNGNYLISTDNGRDGVGCWLQGIWVQLCFPNVDLSTPNVAYWRELPTPPERPA